MRCWRFLVAGVLLGAIGTGIFYRSPQAVGDGLAPKAPSPLPQIGRFQMAGIPGHIYVLDTATGQVWEKWDTPSSGSSSKDFLGPKIKMAAQSRIAAGPEEVPALQPEPTKLREQVRYEAVTIKQNQPHSVFRGHLSAAQYQEWFKSDYAVGGERVEIPKGATVFGALVLTDGDEVAVVPFYQWADGDTRAFRCQGFQLGRAPMFSASGITEEAFFEDMKKRLDALGTATTSATDRRPSLPVSVEDIRTKVTLVGRLGEPLGKMMEVKGTWRFPHAAVKDYSLRFQVSHVNGKKLKKPVEFNVAQVKAVMRGGKNAIPKDFEDRKTLEGVSWTLRAYETGCFHGVPEDYWKEFGIAPSAPPYWWKTFTSELVGVIQK